MQNKQINNFSIDKKKKIENRIKKEFLFVKAIVVDELNQFTRLIKYIRILKPMQSYIIKLINPSKNASSIYFGGKRTISIELTLFSRPSSPLSCSVEMRISSYSTPFIKRFFNISQISTA